MNFLSALKLVISLLPAILEAMRALEAALPDKGSGPTRLAMLLGVLDAVQSSVGGLTDVWESAKPMITNTINKLVEVFNSNGGVK